MPIKSTATTDGGKKKKKIQKNLQNKSKNKNNVFLEPLLSESFPSLGVRATSPP